MSIYHLGGQYLDSAAKCRKRIRELKAQLKEPDLGESQKMMINRRRCVLDAMARDARATGMYLQRYYNDRQEG